MTWGQWVDLRLCGRAIPAVHLERRIDQRQSPKCYVETIRPFDTEFHRLGNTDAPIKSGTQHQGRIVPADGRANGETVEIYELRVRRGHTVPHDGQWRALKPYSKNALCGGQPPQIRLKDRATHALLIRAPTMQIHLHSHKFTTKSVAIITGHRIYACFMMTVLREEERKIR